MTALQHAANRNHGRALYAALDLGTNNCRLLIATPTRNGFRVVDGYSRIVRLGEGLETTGHLDENAMGRTMEALAACTDRLLRHPIRAVRAVATQACRQATNGPRFLERVRRETGIAFEIISPRQEAELAIESCAPLLDPAGRRALLFDIGGGSTELAWLRADTPDRPHLIGYDSLPLGVVTLAERHGPAALTEPGFAAMVDDVRRRLRPFEDIHCIAHEIRTGGVQAVGTSGTVTTLAGVALDLPRYRRPPRRRHDPHRRSRRRRPRHPPVPRPRRPPRPPLRRPRTRRLRPPRLRHLPSHPRNLAPPVRHRRRPRPP